MQPRPRHLVLAIAFAIIGAVVSVAPPASAATFGSASDSFARSVADGLGSADAGGPWTLGGSASRFAVTGGAAAITTPAGVQYSGYLGSTSIADTDVSATLGMNAMPVGNKIYIGLMARHSGSTEYNGRIIVAPGGVVQIGLLAGATGLRVATVSGLTASTTTPIRMRLQAIGANPTTVRARAWQVGTAEPTTWQVSATDSTAALQSAGSVGIRTYLSSAVTNGPLIGTFDDLAAASTTPVNSAPTASFTASTSALSVSFDGTASSDTDGTISGYAWTFGDGTTATGSTVGHTYATAGTYPVTLVVTDDRGATGTTQQAVVLAPANRSPVPVLLEQQNGLTAAFIGDASSDPDGRVVAYSWTFGDGATSPAADPTHTFAAPGTYRVSLTVTDDVGATSTATRSVAVFANGVRPTQTQWLDDATNALSGAMDVIDANATVSKPAIVLDIDNTSLQSYYQPFAATPPLLAVEQRAIADGYSILFATGRSADTGGTLKQLKAAGYRVDALCFRDPAAPSTQASKIACRGGWAAQGYTIVANAGNHTTDLVGGNSGRQFLLPNYAFLD